MIKHRIIVQNKNQIQSTAWKSQKANIIIYEKLSFDGLHMSIVKWNIDNVEKGNRILHIFHGPEHFVPINSSEIFRFSSFST